MPKYPTPSCTGVPAGTNVITTHRGTYRATTPGQVIDKWHITGELHVMADNVVVTNSQIDGGVFNRFGDASAPAYAYKISDSTIGPATGCIRKAGLQSGNYLGTRVHIRGVDHGIDMSEPGNVVLRDSYLVMCWLPPEVAPPDGSHVDGIQSFCPESTCKGVELTHNTFDMRPDGKGTFDINLVDSNLVGPVIVNDNLLAGGDNYVIVAKWHTGPKFIFHNNRLVDGTWGAGNNPYGATSAEGTCANQDWHGNTVVRIDANYSITATVQAIECTD